MTRGSSSSTGAWAISPKKRIPSNVAAAEIAENLTDAEVARLTGLVDESRAVIDKPRQPALDARAGRQ